MAYGSVLVRRKNPVISDQHPSACRTGYHSLAEFWTTDVFKWDNEVANTVIPQKQSTYIPAAVFSPYTAPTSQ